MNLSQWISDNSPLDKRPENYDLIVDDILAQLLGFICSHNDEADTKGHMSTADDSLMQLLFVSQKTKNQLRINPDMIEVAEADSGFVDLVCSGSATGVFSDELCQSGLLCNDEECDNVLAAGIIYEQLKFGEPFDYQGKVDWRNGGSLLNKMIVTDPNERISAKDALQILASENDGRVIINFTEFESGAVVKSDEIIYNSSDFILHLPTNITSESSIKTFYVTDNKDRKIYYRAAPVIECVYCTALKRPDVNKIEYSNSMKKIIVGIDIGFKKINASIIDNNGQIYDVFNSNIAANKISYPICIASDNGGVLFLGSEAETRIRKDLAKPVLIHSCDPANEIEIVKGIYESYDSLLQKLFADFKAELLSRINVDYTCLEFYYILPAEFSDAKKIAYRSALKAIGFGENEVDGFCSVYCWLRKRGILRDNSVSFIIDGGEGAVRIGVVKSDANSAVRTLYKNCCSGGYEMTQKLISAEEAKIKKFDVPDYEDYASNKVILAKNIEEVKKSLTYSKRVRRSVKLQSNGEEKTVVLLHDRRLLNEYISGVKSALNKCLDSCSGFNITDVILLGGLSVMPELIDYVNDCAKRCNSKFHLLDYSEVFARGAAIYGSIQVPIQVKNQAENSVDDVPVEKINNKTTREIGIQIQDPLRNTITFQTKVPIGTQYNDDGNVNFEYDYTVTVDELRNRKCSLKVYTREPGMSHITSTLVDSDKAIRALGMLQITIPEKFKLAKDHLVVTLYIDRNELVTAKVIWKYKYIGFVAIEKSVTDFKFITPR